MFNKCTYEEELLPGAFCPFHHRSVLHLKCFFVRCVRLKAAGSSKTLCTWLTCIFLRRNQRKDFTALTFPNFCLYDTCS